MEAVYSSSVSPRCMSWWQRRQTVDAGAAAFQIREGPAEIAAVPIGLLGDFGDTRLLPAL